MLRENVADLIAFLAVARERSFTRAAAQLGVSQSALSHKMRDLEARLGIRLLTRTTRSVAPTEAGERLLQSIGPRLAEIEDELKALTELRDRPAGTVRITATDFAADTILWPRLTPVLRDYPEIRLEIAVDYHLADIVAQGFDAGVRLGDDVAADMVAVRLGPDLSMTVVATPSYFAERPRPVVPQDLTGHECINLRLPTRGGLYAWEFEKAGQAVNVRVDGRLVLNGAYQLLNSALAGCGLAYMPEDMARPHLDAGRLVRVLEDWCPPYAGHYLYYPSRRQHSAAFAVVVDALRWRG